MDAFIQRKKRKLSKEDETPVTSTIHDDQSTDEKLAILSSIFEDAAQSNLLEALLKSNGSVETALELLLATPFPPRKRPTTMTGVQSSLTFDRRSETGLKAPLLQSTKRGRTLYLFNPDAIAKNTPCSIIHNFLPPDLANDLLRELLPETKTFTSATFRLFERVVQSPHTASFYVNSLADAADQKASYLYNGSTLSDVREILPIMRKVSLLVEKAVNEEIIKRIKSYPGGVKLKHQPHGPWKPNAAFVNCYDGAQQHVGYHTDQLTYLGPHPVIGSLSLGVQREFRIRRSVPPADLTGLDPDSPEAKRLRDEVADLQGQISLPLPHNSLLIMHAEMQEQWKHSIAPAGSKTGGIVPHPVAGLKRVNITYRWYRDEFTPEHIPNCKCGVPTVLKSVMRRETTRGKYVWMCQTPGTVEEGDTAANPGCGYFEFADFDDDGVPIQQ